MGLLDNLVGAVAKQAMNNPQSQQALIQAAMKMISNQPGGLAGLVEKLVKGGLDKEVKSWVSTGANLPVDGAKLQNALGGGQLAALAKSIGLSESQTASGLAAVLPQLVDQLTPDGNVPQQSALDQGLNALAGQLLK